MSLAQSLRSWNTGWCTAGTRTAAHQLSMGDFYVYYTQDEEGKDVVPRVAIRMEDGSVAEVRGINPDQNLNCPPGSLFFALKGDTFDGNRFAAQALESGCIEDRKSVV